VEQVFFSFSPDTAPVGSIQADMRVDPPLNTAWLLFRFQADRDSFWSKEERGREIEKMQDHDEQAAADKIRTGESEELSESEKEEKVEKALARRHRGKTSDIYVAVVIVAVLVSVILFLERFIY
jgi:hypothetical protein